MTNYSAQKLKNHPTSLRKPAQKLRFAKAILPEFRGKVAHDAMTAYEGYCPCEHGPRNARSFRELVYVGEGRPKQQEWGGGLIQLLLETKEEAEQAKRAGQKRVSEGRRRGFINQYEKLIGRAIEINGEPEGKQEEEAGEQGQRVKAKPRGPAAGSLRRVEERREEVLRLMTDPEVPYDNSAAGRGLRMIKSQQKVGGCFRTAEGAGDSAG
ncbi:MAG: transposase [Blastocatellia bacterium]